MRTKIWVKVPCDIRVREELKTRFEEKCVFRFDDDDSIFPAEQAEVIIGEPSREEILFGKDLRWIQLTWAGADKYIKNQDVLNQVVLTNASGAFGGIIAEYVIGTIISLYRNFPSYWKNQRDCIWKKNDSADTIFGKNVLILGTGDIGKNIAVRLKAFGAHINGIRRQNTQETIDGFEKVFGLSSADDLIPDSDIIIGCLPDTVETRDILTYDRLESMKKDAVLINVGRGSLINTDDLIAILKSGHLKGVALDVMNEEPLPADSDLWKLENVIITPHIAGPSFGGNVDVQRAIWNICIENIDRYISGKELINIVDFHQGY